MNAPWTVNDGVVFGILCLILAFVFRTSSRPNRFFRRFYSAVPPLLICYFAPSLFTLLGVYDPEQSHIYFVASQFLLPASLVLLTLGADLREILRLGPKAVTMFLAGMGGVILGGAVSLLAMQQIWPAALDEAGEEKVWRGMATVAGSWIGGGANQTAMKEVFNVKEDLRDKHLWALRVLEGDFVRDTWMDRMHRIGFFVKTGAGQPVECLRVTLLSPQILIAKICLPP